MSMSNRQFLRNVGRIPRLQQHITRVGAKGQKQRVKGFEKELNRRKHEMLAEGHDALLEDLLSIRLEATANADSVKLKKLQDKYAKLLKVD